MTLLQHLALCQCVRRPAEQVVFSEFDRDRVAGVGRLDLCPMVNKR